VNIVPDEKSIKNNGCQEDDGLVSLGESAASKSSRMSAKAKLEKAQAKLRRLAEMKDLERRLEEFKLAAEIEDAQIEMRALKEERSKDNEEEQSRKSLNLPKLNRDELVEKYVESTKVHLKSEKGGSQSSFKLSQDSSLRDDYTPIKPALTTNVTKSKVDVTQPKPLINHDQSDEQSGKSDEQSSPRASDAYSPQVHNLLERQQNTMEQVVRNLSMPQRQFMYFDGDPISYPLFVKNFEINVENKERNDGDRLNYLIQYCTGKAKEAIEHCMMMDPKEGYAKAKEILSKNFGRTHLVAKAFLDKVVKGPPIKINDGERLSQLARDMETCMLGSSQLRQHANLNSLDILGKIVARLPVALKAKWAEKASQLYERGLVPQFSHLADFIQERAAVANTFFGQLVQDSKDKEIPKVRPKCPAVAVRATTLATTSSTTATTKNTAERKNQNLKCKLCGAEHYLDKCEQFQNKKVDERNKFVMDKRLCRVCLKGGHQAKDCRWTRVCGVDGCKSKHHSLLHSSVPKTSPTTSSSPAVFPASITPSTSLPVQNTVTTNVARPNTIKTESRQISLKVVPVKVSVPDNDQVIETYAFLDDGSDTSMCLQSLAQELGAPSTPVNFVLSTMSGSEERCGKQLSLDVVGVSTGKGVRLDKVWTTDYLPVSKNTLSNEDLKTWPHLNNVHLAEIGEKDIKILIGNDAPEALCPLEVKSGGKGQPYAVRTLLGWAVAGPLESKGSKEAKMNFVHVDQALGCDDSETVMSRVESQLEQLYNAEFTENSASVNECLSLEDRRAKEIMDKSITVVDGHYQVGLPWKYDTVDLPNNRCMAVKRINLLKKRLQRDSELLKKYTETMEMYIAKGHAVRVTEEAPPSDEKNGPVWYLPHHPVTHPQKPEKVRVVFDCAATYGGKSLNTELLQGPDNTNSLVGVLVRFRQERVAIMSDVEQMFHQVYVDPKDRDALRFLWWPGGDVTKDPVDYKMQVHLFGATSSPSVCSYSLRKAAEDSKDDYDELTVETVNDNFYVDDCLKSVPTVDEGIKLANDLTSLLSKKGFKLTKWMSNEKKVMEQIPVAERAKSVNLDLEDLPVERALGVKWNVKEDTLGFRQGKETVETRRGLLSFISSIYDPLGLVAPVVLPAKMILQELCRLKHGWDEILPEDVSRRLADVKDNISYLTNIEVPRCYKPPQMKEIKKTEIHHFSDASTDGYGTASYLRFVDEEDNVHCSLILGKSRVAPLKTVTIPRLELTAATVAAKVDRQLNQELQLPVQRVVYWTDSMVVLRYILNQTKRFNTFVANRLQVIHDASSPLQWRYVPSESNPADLASRGIKKEQREKSLETWLNGPDFLWKSEDEWPSIPQDAYTEVQDDDSEVKKRPARAHVNVTSSKVKETPKCLVALIDSISSWYRLCKVVAWLVRFKKYMMSRYGKTKCEASKEPLTVKEISGAEDDVVKLVQKEVFKEEQQKNGRLRNLCPFLQEDIVRVGSRLERADIDSNAKYPAILPSRHHITDLIVRHYHIKNGHVGSSQTLAAIRQRYWILKGPSTVRRILNSCFQCRRQNQRPLSQVMAPLPAARVKQGSPPFTAVGVDYFGPLQVKYRRGTVKRYGCVFTCMSTRAVHIEVSSDLSTDSFVQAVYRFVSRRGPPKEIYSDNGTNFRGAEVEVKEALCKWNQDRIRERLRQQGIEWHFNAPAASHTGGVWERMIRSIRKILRALVGNKLLDDETLMTTLCEVEKILNDRPLVKATDDPNDLEALTPNALLLLRQNSSVSPLPEQTSVNLKERRKEAQRLADQFWQRWLAEYLPTLHERQKWLRPRRNIAVGDLVLVSDDNVSRGNWPLGIVIETFPDDKGLVRHLQVRTAKGVYRRNIRKLCLLEASDGR